MKKTKNNERNKPKASIIVASYNYENYIKETLDSLVAQTYRDFEVIVVDDGSKDSSLNIIKKYEAKYDYIHIYTHENGANKGLVATLKLALSKAQGEYIAFCESDDYWRNDYLDKKIALIEKNKNVAIIGNDIQLIGNTDLKQSYISACNITFEGRNKIKLPALQDKVFNPLATFSAVMVKRDILMSCDFDTPIPAWLDFWLWRQILAVYPAYYINEKISFWRIHESYNADANAAEYSKKSELFIKESNKIIQAKLGLIRFFFLKFWEKFFTK
ncbi:MAG: glycosyltransferase [Candidatus Gastranaerophilales bacterium]|nr:glycosyltransferase [Candidatus Gastranaerophilales bacterium]